LCLLGVGDEKRPEKIIEAIGKNKVTTMHFVPSMLNVFLDYLDGREVGDAGEVEKLATLKQVFASGEALPLGHVNRFNRLLNKTNGTRLINLYGPTEATVDVSYYNCPTAENLENIPIPIGKPIDNIKLYVVDKELHLQPVGVTGELCISGVGLARGYLGRPELTAGKFLPDPYAPGERLYKTGDNARWLPDGNIEYLGRIDHQVKIRGFRIELGEIENRIVAHEDVKEVVVTAKEDENGDKTLCAYVVYHQPVQVASLRTYLSGILPEYMIPAFFVALEAIPLNPNGKIDLKALPEPEIGTAGIEYIPPRDELEEKLVRIWSKLLNTEKEKISIKNNFFEIGGHSLKAITMMTAIHKQLGVKLTLEEIFKTLTVEQMAKTVRDNKKEAYLTIEPAEQKTYYPLSSAQKRLYILQQMDENSTGYNMCEMVVLEGNLDREKLEGTFKKLIARHESLRTYFLMIDGEPVQKIAERVQFEIRCIGVGGKEHDLETITGRFVRPFRISQPPLFRVELIKTGDGHGNERHILMVDMHHIISDGLSMELFIKEFMEIYAGKEPAPFRLQYKDFSQWQNSRQWKELNKNREAYWLKEYEGEKPVLNLPTDYPRPPVWRFEGKTAAFRIE
ncbi:MAG: AMP-binding protein, partial [bacterium]|nr:AMP-binding protein [bacterium]